MRHPLLRILVLLIAVGTLPACSSLSKLGGKLGGVLTPNHENDFAQVGERLEDEAARYKEHLLRVVNVVVDPAGNDQYYQREGVMTEPQFTVFEAAVKNVKAANQPVKADMAEWAASGVRPAMMMPHKDALVKAQNEVIRLVQEVRP